jgi:mono/diheme cytochrome c family protein
MAAMVGLGILVARAEPTTASPPSAANNAAPASATQSPAAPTKALPPPVNRPVDFLKEVVPIFQSSCVNCHSSGKTEADLSVETREKLIEGGASAPAIEPGNSADRLLIQLVAGLDPDPGRYMPKKGKKLTAEQIGILRAWIDQGAKWPKGSVVADRSKPIPAKLEPRQVPIPAPHDGLTNPIDLLLVPYFQEHQVKPGKLVDDRVFARRVYLDVIGLLPPPAELEQFVADKNPNKRAELVHKLLDDGPRYAAHWMSFWNDLLRNDYKGTGYIDGGRLQITRWLYSSLLENKPYDRFVSELVTGSKGAEGFTKGIVWRGVVNAAQTPQMQAAQNIGQVFMGVNLKCASCHDSFISQWKLTDSYGLAGVYADKPLEMARCTRPLGKTAPMKFLYPELGTIDPNAPKEKRVQQLADAVTNEKNGRLSRTMVNRIWKRLMGRGLIEPVDEMDNKPWSQDVLDALAWSFAHEQHYDLKKAIETIVLSRAYQLESVPQSESDEKDFVFRGPCIKRMTAEQFVDAVARVGDVWPTRQDAKLTDAAERYGAAKWIWSSKDAAASAAPGTIYLRRVLSLKPGLKALSATIACDNQATLYVNGRKAVAGADFTKPVTVDLLPLVTTGKNMLAVVATNDPGQPGARNPAGFWCHVEATYAQPIKGKTRFALNSDAKWSVSTTRPSGEAWKTAAFDDKAWPKAAVAGEAGAAPWNLLALLSGDEAAGAADRPPEIRCAFCAADPLTTALGRPNRDVVNSVRPTEATTLMALEMTNGATLNDMLDRAAKKLAAEKDLNPEQLVDRIYASALGRAPTPAERATASQALGPKVTQEGAEDFLWAVVMLPEFQLVR